MNKGLPVYPADASEENGDITGETFAANLPNYTSPLQPWVVDFVEEDSYLDFFNAFYDSRNNEPLYPYRYGSFQVFQANNITQ